MRLHEYSIESEDAFSRIKVHAVLAVFSAAFVAMGRKVFVEAVGVPPDATAISVAFWVGALGPLTLFGLLWSLFDRFLWRTWLGRFICKLVGCAPTPYLGGTYTARSEWATWPDKTPRSRNSQVFIRQTWSRICISLSGEGIDVRSRSVTAHVRTTEASCELVYTFEFQSASSTGIKRSGGTQYLNLTKSAEKRWEGCGFYYTEHGDCGKLQVNQERLPFPHRDEQSHERQFSGPRRPRITLS